MILLTKLANYIRALWALSRVKSRIITSLLQPILELTKLYMNSCLDQTVTLSDL
jgi:hypothetical protein